MNHFRTESRLFSVMDATLYKRKGRGSYTVLGATAIAAFTWEKEIG